MNGFRVVAAHLLRRLTPAGVRIRRSLKLAVAPPTAGPARPPTPNSHRVVVWLRAGPLCPVTSDAPCSEEHDMHHIDLNSVVRSHGSHSTREEGTCLLEMVAWWVHAPHSDEPDCVDVTLARFGRQWNDGMRTDAERAQLRRIPVLSGTAGTPEDASRRAWLALDLYVRMIAEGPHDADLLAAMPPIEAPAAVS